MGKKITVTNRSNGFVGYNLPELRIRREFNPRETKQVDFDELVALTSQGGGSELIYNYLLIKDQAAMREILNVQEDPEYWLTEAQIPTWMEKCSLDEFKDALEFAPDGVKDLIKKYAVENRLNNVSKRKAIQDILGFNVDAAITIEEQSKEETVDAISSANSKRRTNASSIEVPEENNSNKYNIVKVLDQQ